MSVKNSNKYVFEKYQDKLNDLGKEVYASFSESEECIVLVAPRFTHDTLEVIEEAGLTIIDVSPTSESGPYGMHEGIVLKLSV
jgi:hypothetical protein